MTLWTELLETAVHAPSPHNVQPWRVRINSETVAELLIEKRRTLPKEDVTGSFMILTMGLFIEALSILAANRGYHLRHELLQQLSQFASQAIERTNSELLPFAKLYLEVDNKINGKVPESLFLTRRTSRISLRPDPVPTKAVQALSSLASEFGQRYEQITDPQLIEKILDCDCEALFEDLNMPAYHDEIVEWFRFTDRSSRKNRDGLDYRCMNASRTSFWMIARLPQLLQFPLTRPLFKKAYRKQIGVVPTLGMFAGPFWEPENAFPTGRFLMRAWLELARHDLFIHPYGNLVTNQRAATWLVNETGLEKVWLIFKIGYSNQPPKSYRRSVEEVLVV